MLTCQVHDECVVGKSLQGFVTVLDVEVTSAAVLHIAVKAETNIPDCIHREAFDQPYLINARQLRQSSGVN